MLHLGEDLTEQAFKDNFVELVIATTSTLNLKGVTYEVLQLPMSHPLTLFPKSTDYLMTSTPFIINTRI